jgi:hypothetical protein
LGGGIMELENCSKCKWWEPIEIIVDGRKKCLKDSGRRVWDCAAKEYVFPMRIPITANDRWILATS